MVGQGLSMQIRGTRLCRLVDHDPHILNGKHKRIMTNSTCSSLKYDKGPGNKLVNALLLVYYEQVLIETPGLTSLTNAGQIRHPLSSDCAKRISSSLDSVDHSCKTASVNAPETRSEPRQTLNSTLIHKGGLALLLLSAWLCSPNFTTSSCVVFNMAFWLAVHI